MLKELKIIPEATRHGRRYVPELAEEKNSLRKTIRCGWRRRSGSYWSMQMQWTAEVIEDLKKLALEGRSAAAIAATLGVGSRNAVIGKASRIGIKLNGGGRATASGRTGASALRAQLATIANPLPGASKPSSAAVLPRDLRVVPGSQPGDAGKTAAAWTLGEAEVGEMRRLRFEDIRESACRWPLGDPRSGDFAYCGLQPVEGQSYCAGHCRMAYRSPQARQSARERQRAIGNSWRVA
jgi:GcrA cell cycle regulator